MQETLIAGAVFPDVALLVIVGLMLICGGLIHSDVTRRRIPNGYCLAICALAVPWWIGQEGWGGLIGLLEHLLVPLIAAVPLLLLFALRILAGGDVKLLLALLLWIPASSVAAMLIVTVITGGVLALAIKALSRLFCSARADTVPYAIPIVTGALLILIPQLRAAL